MAQNFFSPARQGLNRKGLRLRSNAVVRAVLQGAQAQKIELRHGPARGPQWAS